MEGAELIIEPQGLLRAHLDRNNISLPKFSRWLRAICTILLARNQDNDRAKVLGYVDQAVAVLQDQEQSGQLDADADVRAFGIYSCR